MTILNIEEAADLLKMSRRSLETLVRSGKIPATEFIGKWIFSEDQLIKYVESLAANNIDVGTIKEPKKTPSKRGKRRNAPLAGYDGKCV